MAIVTREMIREDMSKFLVKFAKFGFPRSIFFFEIRIDAALASAAVAAGAVVTKEGLAEPPAAGLARLELPPESNSFKVISKTMKCIFIGSL